MVDKAEYEFGEVQIKSINDSVLVNLKKERVNLMDYKCGIKIENYE